LQKVFAIVFGQKISKSQRLSNWENNVLTAPQKLYAATDAWATLLIYTKLMGEKKISEEDLAKIIAENTPAPKPENAENVETPDVIFDKRKKVRRKKTKKLTIIPPPKLCLP
jgi:ribonuclease D